MIGPAFMFIIGFVFLFLNPFVGGVMMLCALMILPQSKEMDDNIAAIEAANPMPARDPVNGCFSFALGTFAIVVIIAALTLILGIDV